MSMILVGLGANLPDAQGRGPRETVTAAIAALAAAPACTWSPPRGCGKARRSRSRTSPGS
ncbi:hypothetical protein [Oleomonas cavernae]|uniref:hypothetical protein n=1 Tax=Oleomonas cavernae TaxID=2320859 RepID=UPI001F2840B0|nr:hypothetical protein [Oleomonas cavernae]